MSLSIRPSSNEEAETHFALQRAASLAGLAHIYPPEQYPYPDDEIRRRWRETTGMVLLAELAGEPVGVAMVEACWLANRSSPLNSGIPVLRENPDQLAHALHDAALDAMPDCAELKLWVLEENRRARRFYEKHGWRQNGETRVVEYPPNPLDVGYSFIREEP